jgi:hypothetical protein
VDRPYDIRRAITYRVRRLAPLIALAAALAAGPARAPAAPSIEVKAQTQLVLEKVRALGDGEVEVRGALVDRLTGKGLANQLVTVRLGADDDDHRAAVRTHDDGKFSAIVREVTAGEQPIELEFSGAGLLDRAEPFTATTDPARAQVALKLTAEDAPGGSRITATAEVDGRPTELPIQLSAGPPSGELRPLGSAQTGAPLLFTRARAGGPGTQRVRAAYAGDDSKQPATAELTLELRSVTRTTLALASASLAYEDDLVATGAVTDDDGRPVPRAAVTLSAVGGLAGDRRLAQGATGADGTYRFEVEAELLGAGQVGVQVRAEPGAPSVLPSSSPPVNVLIAAPQPVPVSYTIIAFLATAVAAGGFFTARARPWQRFRRQAPPAEAPEHGGDAEPTAGGLVLNRPGLVSTLRRAHDDGFSGVVRDAVRGRPVEGAAVRLILQEERETQSGADGAFAIERLGPGEWRAEVAAPGHVTEKFAVTIPHRGELRGVRIDLVPVRERVFQLYRRAAEPILPEPRLWGIWSPRQIMEHVRAHRPSPALAELTDFVEEVYFSQRVSDEDVLATAAERVDRAIGERAASGRPGGDRPGGDRPGGDRPGADRPRAGSSAS